MKNNQINDEKYREKACMHALKCRNEELKRKNEADSEFYTGSMDCYWKSTIQECVYNESVRLRI